MLVHETNQPPTSLNDPGDATWKVTTCRVLWATADMICMGIILPGAFTTDFR